MTPYHHALSSARRWGGTPLNYLQVHQWFDESKGHFPDVRHRALRHHSEGIFACETVFGPTLTNSEGRVVPVRQVAELHVKEDLGWIPTVKDWLRHIRVEPWMLRVAVKSRDLAGAQAAGPTVPTTRLDGCQAGREAVAEAETPGAEAHPDAVGLELRKMPPAFPASRETGGRNATLVARADVLIARSPRLGVLRRYLLGLGGDEVDLASTEFDLEALIERGRLFPEARLRLSTMERSNCHRNASRLWGESGGALGIATGYALADDGIWLQHSWGFEDGSIVETTAVRARYYGFPLGLEEAVLFASWNLS